MLADLLADQYCILLFH